MRGPEPTGMGGHSRTVMQKAPNALGSGGQGRQPGQCFEGPDARQMVRGRADPADAFHQRRHVRDRLTDQQGIYPRQLGQVQTC